MGEAFLWGALASSSLLIGGVIALRFSLGKRAVGLIMAFGAGVLISAVAYELVEEAYVTGAGAGGLALGLAAGALTFYAGDSAIERLGARRAGGSVETGDATPSTQGETQSGLSIVLGIILDGIPESVVLGLTVLEGGGVSIAFLAAVFLSNLPESIAATAALKNGGWDPPRIMGLWSMMVLVCAVAAMLGYVILEGAAPRRIAFVQAFAAGAILTMLADTLMPEAYEHGGKPVGLMTTCGFAVAFGLTVLD
jgi:ZIP family zinc transporter